MPSRETRALPFVRARNTDSATSNANAVQIPAKTTRDTQDTNLQRNSNGYADPSSSRPSQPYDDPDTRGKTAMTVAQTLLPNIV